MTKLFNLWISTQRIPIEWKTAVVSNNYRGISVLIPVAKIFERILASQITIYLNINNIQYSGQHGFRTSHSCETALHELLSDLNSIRDQKKMKSMKMIKTMKIRHDKLGKKNFGKLRLRQKVFVIIGKYFG